MDECRGTSVTVYEDSKFTVDLDEQPEIAGIRGSSWATPALYLQYKDGTEEMVDCYTGESSSEKSAWFDLGGLSSPAQDWVDQVKRPKLN